MPPVPRNDHVFVQYGRNRYYFEFPEGAIKRGEIRVADLKDRVALAIGIAPDKLSLLAAGQTLKADHEPLHAYRVASGAKILCMAERGPSFVGNPVSWIKNQLSTSGGEANAPAAPAPKAPRQPAATAKASHTPQQPASVPKPVAPVTNAERIDQETTETKNTLGPLIDKFETDPPADVGKRQQEHDRLAEMLLQRLMKLDGIQVSEADRAKRKGAVRWTQSLLDRVDNAMK